MDVQRAVHLEGGPHNKTWDETIVETIAAVTYVG